MGGRQHGEANVIAPHHGGRRDRKDQRAVDDQ
jgi:hypothetical protein